MKEYFVIILLLFFTLKTNSQSGVVDYSVTVNNDIIEEKNDSLPNKYKNILNESANIYQEDFKYKLKFNRHESYFDCLKIMDNESDNLKYRIAKIIFNYRSIYYTNSIENEKIEQIFTYGEFFRITDSLNTIKWTLSKEKKEIKGYICYKAITKKRVINSEGTFHKDIVAWYTPELPYNYGPKGYGSLPGLILELKDEYNISYHATEIKIDFEKNSKIKKPSKGKLMTVEEFEKFSLGVDISFD